MIYPRIAAIVPLLFGVVLLVVMPKQMRAKKQRGIVWFLLLICLGCGLAACASFAYHIALGHRIGVSGQVAQKGQQVQSEGR